jgi:polyisoprenoid-binding protein YceI
VTPAHGAGVAGKDTPVDRQSRLQGGRLAAPGAGVETEGAGAHRAVRAAALSLALLAGPGAYAEPVTYVIEPTHTFVHWEVLHFGTSTVRGRFGGVSGSVTLDRQARSGQISIAVDTTTLDTGIAPFNAKLRSNEFFDVAQHPKAWFVASRLQFDGDRLKSVTGELTLHGVSQGVTLTATRFNCHDHPMLQRQVCGGDFEASLRRGEFGLAYGAPLVADQVRLLIQVEAIRQ